MVVTRAELLHACGCEQGMFARQPLLSSRACFEHNLALCKPDLLVAYIHKSNASIISVMSMHTVSIMPTDIIASHMVMHAISCAVCACMSAARYAQHCYLRVIEPGQHQGMHQLRCTGPHAGSCGACASLKAAHRSTYG